MTSSHNIHSIYNESLPKATVILLIFVLKVSLNINLELWLWDIDTKSVLSVLGIENDSVLRVLFDMTCIDHLREQFSGTLVVQSLLFCFLHTCSQALQLLHVLYQFLSFEGFLLLLLLYLCSGTSTLALFLQHICTLATSHYILKRD